MPGRVDDRGSLIIVIRNLIALVIGIGAGLAGGPIARYLGDGRGGFWAFCLVFLVLVPGVICLVARSWTIGLAIVPSIVWTAIYIFEQPHALGTVGDVLGTALALLCSLGPPLLIGLVAANRKGTFFTR